MVSNDFKNNENFNRVLIYMFKTRGTFQIKQCHTHFILNEKELK